MRLTSNYRSAPLARERRGREIISVVGDLGLAGSLNTQESPGWRKGPVMDYVVVDAVLGLLIGVACIGIPQLVRKRRQRPADDDTKAYLKETGRTPREIAQGNAALESRQENDASSQQASGSDGP